MQITDISPEVRANMLEGAKENQIDLMILPEITIKEGSFYPAKVDGQNYFARVNEWEDQTLPSGARAVVMSISLEKAS